MENTCFDRRLVLLILWDVLCVELLDGRPVLRLWEGDTAHEDADGGGERADRKFGDDRAGGSAQFFLPRCQPCWHRPCFSLRGKMFDRRGGLDAHPTRV